MSAQLSNPNVSECHQFTKTRYLNRLIGSLMHFKLNFVLSVCDFYRWILLLYLVFESFVLREVSFITWGGLLKLETYVEKTPVLPKLF